MNNVNKNDNVIEIDLLELFRALMRNVVWILIAAVICGVGAFAFTSAFVTPKYTASALFYVNNSNFTVGTSSFSITSGELSAAQTLVNTYVEILNSRPTLEKVMEEAGVEYSLKDFREEILETENVQNTGIFKVSVTTENPLEAELVANTITKVLPDRISEIVDGSSVRIVESAVVPSARSSPNLIKITAIAMFLGAFIVCCVICCKVIFAEPPVQVVTSADILKELWPDIPVLAMVPDAREVSEKKNYDSYYKKEA